MNQLKGDNLIQSHLSTYLPPLSLPLPSLPSLPFLPLLPRGLFLFISFFCVSFYSPLFSLLFPVLSLCVLFHFSLFNISFCAFRSLHFFSLHFFPLPLFSSTILCIPHYHSFFLFFTFHTFYRVLFLLPTISLPLPLHSLLLLFPFYLSHFISFPFFILLLSFCFISSPAYRLPFLGLFFVTFSFFLSLFHVFSSLHYLSSLIYDFVLFLSLTNFLFTSFIYFFPLCINLFAVFFDKFFFCNIFFINFKQ